MQLHQLKTGHKRKDKKRRGRGGKRGTYSGRGIKGQKARAGARLKPQIRDIIKKYPKKRGYRFQKVRPKPVVLNVAVLEKKFQDNSKITPQSLLKAGLIGRIKGREPEVKILAKGKLAKPFLVSGCKVSKKAKEKIEKAKGKIIES